jgi:uncharacterized protein (UPF0276 family)
MASACLSNSQRKKPALATTYEGDSPALLERICKISDVIEISPDTVAQSTDSGKHLREGVLLEYKSVAAEMKFVAHGVGLSIGSHDHWDEDYLQLLDELFERFPLLWHSEHLACTMVDGESLGTMLALPRTEEVLDLLCERIKRLQERYRAPFLLEHVIRLLPEPEAEYTDAAFLNALTRRSGCGLILDAYNLQCDRLNFGFDVESFLGELDFSPVKELHLAGGAQHKGFQLDIHSRPTDTATLELGKKIMARASNLELITYEFLKEAIPNLGHDRICDELVRIEMEMQL